MGPNKVKFIVLSKLLCEVLKFSIYNTILRYDDIHSTHGLHWCTDGDSMLGLTDLIECRGEAERNLCC